MELEGGVVFPREYGGRSWIWENGNWNIFSFFWVLVYFGVGAGYMDNREMECIFWGVWFSFGVGYRDSSNAKTSKPRFCLCAFVLS